MQYITEWPFQNPCSIHFHSPRPPGVDVICTELLNGPDNVLLVHLTSLFSFFWWVVTVCYGLPIFHLPEYHSAQPQVLKCKFLACFGMAEQLFPSQGDGLLIKLSLVWRLAKLLELATRWTQGFSVNVAYQERYYNPFNPYLKRRRRLDSILERNSSIFWWLTGSAEIVALLSIL